MNESALRDNEHATSHYSFYLYLSDYIVLRIFLCFEQIYIVCCGWLPVVLAVELGGYEQKVWSRLSDCVSYKPWNLGQVTQPLCTFGFL